MSVKFEVNYEGLRRKGTYDELVDLTRNPEQLSEPNRLAKQLRETPQLSSLLDGEGALSMVKLGEQQERAAAHQKVEQTIREAAASPEAPPAQEMRAAETQTARPQLASGSTQTGPQLFDLSADDRVASERRRYASAERAHDEAVASQKRRIVDIWEATLGEDVSPGQEDLAHRMASAAAASSGGPPMPPPAPPAAQTVAAMDAESSASKREQPAEPAQPKSKARSKPKSPPPPPPPPPQPMDGGAPAVKRETEGRSGRPAAKAKPSPSPPPEAMASGSPSTKREAEGGSDRPAAKPRARSTKREAKAQAAQDGGTGAASSSDVKVKVEETGAPQGFEKPHTKGEWVKMGQNVLRKQLRLLGKDESDIPPSATREDLVELLAQLRPEMVRQGRGRASTRSRGPPPGLQPRGRSLPGQRKSRSRSDDAQLTGIAANKSTDMDFWKEQSANELRAQITFRQGRRADWAVKNKAQLVDLVRQMIADGTW